MKITKVIFKNILSPEYERLWQQFAIDHNGIFVEGKYGNLDSVEINYQNHTIIFDRYIHYQVVGGQSLDKEFTRIRLQFKTADDVRFRLTKQGLIDSIGKILGAQDIQTGDKAFDDKFMIKGNNEFKIQSIFSNKILKNLLLKQKDILLEILEKNGIFDEPINDGYLMLYYISESVVKDKVHLDALLELYITLIDQLIKTKSINTIKRNY